ncbi:MAG: glycosyltransferase [Thermoleophilaceae bacterium]|nr:glycosyltransferase [Thermoleophilaceae bacterium]
MLDERVTPRAPAMSVVVATHNRSLRLRQLLAGLRAQTLPLDAFEVVVVDDGSSDATQEVLTAEARRGDLRLCIPPPVARAGPAAARNAGWRLARAPFVAFTDDDCVPTPGWLETLLDAARRRPDAIVRGRTLPNPAEAHALGSFSKTIHIDGPSANFETCNVAYPRTLLERIGGFDESYGAGMGEDSDLGCRALAAGGLPAFEPGALVHHAVIARRPAAALRDALHATDHVRLYKEHPRLRRNLFLGVFHDRSHPLLLAALGALLARRRPEAALLAVPYALHLGKRVRARGARPRHAAFFALFDGVQLLSTLRGARKHRTFVL